jgi:hypothetical protein
MAKDWRIVRAGAPVPYTCENRRYKTDLRKGNTHGPYGSAKGSVTATRLVDHSGYTLWLEHVVDKNDDSEAYWLMWYGPKSEGGQPTIPLSGVLNHDELSEMIKELIQYVPR